ncbi:MAG: SPOR domain-containing protein [Deltaproteobacteria bacterium]|jgi:cell division septation protein DedD|nr:SPOR domain-containing protein [Deltaproteobacteria bacterium]
MADDKNVDPKLVPKDGTQGPDDGILLDLTELAQDTDDGSPSGPGYSRGPGQPGHQDADSGPGLDFEGLLDSEGPLDQGEDWEGDGSPARGGPGNGEPPSPGSMAPGMKLAILAAIVIAVGAAYYLFSGPSGEPAPAPPTAQSEPSQTAPSETPDQAAAPGEPGPDEFSLQGKSLEVGVGPVKRGEPSEDQMAELLNTEVDPSSTVPGGWNFAPPQDPPAARTEALGEDVTIIEATDSGTMIMAADETQPQLTEGQMTEGLATEGEMTEELATEGQISEGQITEPAEEALAGAAEAPPATGLAPAPGDEELPLVSEIVPTPDEAPGPAAEPVAEPVAQAPVAEAPAVTPPEPVAQTTPETPAAPVPPAAAEPVAQAPAVTPPAPVAKAPAETPAAPVPAAEPAEGRVVVEEEISELWVANLLSTPSGEEADAAWGRLRAQDGANLLYRYEAEVDGTKQHRLRLGFFPDRAAAEAAAVGLAQKAGLGSPWMVRPNMAEVNKYNVRPLSELWAVNVSSTPDKAESDAIWEALDKSRALETLGGQEGTGKALSLYRSETLIDGKTQYRIRLGFFDDDAKAKAAGLELAKAGGLEQSRIGLPWAVRPNQSEVEANKK